MSILKYINRIKKIDQLIAMKATGTPSEFAGKLDISQRRLHEIIEELKSIGIPIKYNRSRKSYYYTEAGRFKIQFENFNDQKINLEEMGKIFGGKRKDRNFFFCCDNNALKSYILGLQKTLANKYLRRGSRKSLYRVGNNKNSYEKDKI